MADGVTVGITIREDVTAALNRLAAAGSDLTRPMKDIAGHLADETRERFETGRDPSGRPWKPSRRVLGLDGSKDGKDGRSHGPHRQDGQTLVDTGDLLASIREDWGSDYAAAGPEASGGAAVYAKIHQFGGKITPRDREGKDGARPALKVGGRYLASVTIPARPYLGFTDADADYVVEALAEHLAAVIGGDEAGAAS